MSKKQGFQRRPPGGGRLRLAGSGGLTLIELLCVVALIGLVFAVGVLPGLHRGGKRQLETAAWRLASDMRLARQSAITTGVSTCIQFRLFGENYKLIYPDGEKIVKLPAEVGYCYLNFPEVDGLHLLEFRSTGAPNRGGTVGLKSGPHDKLYIIVTPATGRVRVAQTAPAE